MKIIHSLQNSDVLSASSLSEAFSKQRVNKKLCVSKMSFRISDIFRNNKSTVTRIKGQILLESEERHPIWKMVIYFPESKYAVEQIIEGNDFEVDFVHKNKTEREYFNVVLFDKDDWVISSSTYVFDENRVVEHPIQEKDMSALHVKTELSEINNHLILETKLESTLDSVNHIWQNVGQHFLFEQPLRKEGNVYTTSLSKEKMCSGIWMIIVTDKEDRLLTQYIVTL